MKAPPVAPRTSSPPGEIPTGAALLLLGLGSRLAFVTAFPTLPVSDFRGLVAFAQAFGNGAWITQGRSWELYSPGLPLALAPLLRLSPWPADDTARLATAVACGLLPLLPFLLWRRVLPLAARATAGFLLALWPGQVVFSGVVAQDDWVLLPTVALGALTVRALVAGRRYPLAAALLYGAGVAVRQEMLVALLPLLLGAGLGPWSSAAWKTPAFRRGAATLALATLALLAALASLRAAATGRFALTSQHGGLALLGSYVPGATENFWADPAAYIASVEPALLADRGRMQAAGFRLALREALRRPGFHALRIASSVVKFAVDGEAASFYWSLGPEVLPDTDRARADRFIAAAVPWLRRELAALQALFLAALAVGVRRRSAPILLLATAVALKVAIHAIVVSQGRYFLAATALEILAIAVAAWEVAAGRDAHLPRFAATALAGGTAVALLLLFAAPRLEARVVARDRRDQETQRAYRFPLTAKTVGSLDCTMERGLLADLDTGTATLATLAVDPHPGDTAEAVCLYTRQPGEPPARLQVEDGYAPGGLPGRMRIEVTVDGVRRLDHDLAAEPWTGWLDVPLDAAPPSAVPDARHTVRVALIAVHPDPGAAWGRAARTAFRLAPREGS